MLSRGHPLPQQSGRFVLWNHLTHLLSQPVLMQWSHEQSDSVKRMETTHGPQSVGSLPSWLIQLFPLIPAWDPSSRNLPWTLDRPVSQEEPLLHQTLDPLGRHPFVLTRISTLDMNLFSLPTPIWRLTGMLTYQYGVPSNTFWIKPPILCQRRYTTRHMTIPGTASPQSSQSSQRVDLSLIL